MRLSASFLVSIATIVCFSACKTPDPTGSDAKGTSPIGTIPVELGYLCYSAPGMNDHPASDSSLFLYWLGANPKSRGFALVPEEKKKHNGEYYYVGDHVLFCTFKGLFRTTDVTCVDENDGEKSFQFVATDLAADVTDKNQAQFRATMSVRGVTSDVYCNATHEQPMWYYSHFHH